MEPLPGAADGLTLADARAAYGDGDLQAVS